jgi:hypothetical protein
MIFRQRLNHTFEDPRGKALQSAIVLRDCSLLMQTSFPPRRACRTLMREQSIIWRRTLAAQPVSAFEDCTG